jgi:N utilization substance protein A
MLVALGKDDVKDHRGLCRLRHRRFGRLERRAQGWRSGSLPGALSDFDVSKTDAEAMIMQARVAAGWITAEELMAQRDDMNDRTCIVSGETWRPCRAP